MQLNTILRAATAAMAVISAPAYAENADYYRGGWRTDGGEPHFYQFVIDGAKVTGVYCTRCADGTTLAPIEGTFSEAHGLDFTIRHLDLAGKTLSADRLNGRLAGGTLVVSGTLHGKRVDQVTIKDPRGPVPGPYVQSILPPGAPPVPVLTPGAGAGAGGPPPAYARPAPWRDLTADDVVGVWLGFGVGMDKQYFLIRKDGEKLFGIACGRCDNPYTFGALENFRIEGKVLEFDIVHQDWGDGTILPFNRHVTANISMNEMRMDARRPDQDGPGIVASLVGPISIEATRGNVIAE